MTAPTMPTPAPPHVTTELASIVDAALAQFVSSYPMPGNLRQAVRYALLGGGKRLRPVLALLSCQAVGGERDDALPAAMAVEFIHAFSLVHDDLPAMDDDDLRRGRPTLHVAKGEAMAILAGDMMLGLAYSVLVEGRVERSLAGQLAAQLAQGANAMIAGQVYDTLGGFSHEPTDPERLELIHRNKTGALITASCKMGALSGLSHTPDAQADRALLLITTYAQSIGLMFQIVDDLIDIEQTAEHTGKETGKDLDAGKLTYPGVLGIEPSRAEIDRLRRIAIDALSPLGRVADPLRDLCEYLAVRTK